MEFLGVGPGELFVILILLLIVFGPERLPELARQAGRMVVSLRNWVARSPDAAMVLRARDELEQEFRAIRDSLNEELQAVRDEVQMARNELTQATRLIEDSADSVGKAADDALNAAQAAMQASASAEQAAESALVSAETAEQAADEAADLVEAVEAVEPSAAGGPAGGAPADADVSSFTTMPPDPMQELNDIIASSNGAVPRSGRTRFAADTGLRPMLAETGPDATAMAAQLEQLSGDMVQVRAELAELRAQLRGDDGQRAASEAETLVAD